MIKVKIRQIFETWIPVIVFGLGIAYFSLTPYQGSGFIWNMNDVAKHFIAYFFLSFLMVFPANRQWGGMSFLNRMIWVIAVCTLYGVMLEVGQLFSPTRSFSVTDAVTNLAGSFAAQVVAYIVVSP